MLRLCLKYILSSKSSLYVKSYKQVNQRNVIVSILPFLFAADDVDRVADAAGRLLALGDDCRGTGGTGIDIPCDPGDHGRMRPVELRFDVMADLGQIAVPFAGGAALPLGVAIAAPLSSLSTFVTIASLASLMVLGGLAARAGGAAVLRGSIRVTLWGAVAMALTALVGRAFGAVL